MKRKILLFDFLKSFWDYDRLSCCGENFFLFLCFFVPSSCFSPFLFFSFLLLIKKKKNNNNNNNDDDKPFLRLLLDSDSVRNETKQRCEVRERWLERRSANMTESDSSWSISRDSLELTFSCSSRS